LNVYKSKDIQKTVKRYPKDNQKKPRFTPHIGVQNGKIMKNPVFETRNPETCRRLSILYIETWGKPVQIYPTYRCIKWKIMKSPVFETRNPETCRRLSILNLG